MVVAVRNIATEEEITVKYGNGYYGNRCRCKTCTKVDPRDLSVLKPKFKEENAVEREGAGEDEEKRS